MKAIIYCRQSTEDQSEYSLNTQLDECQQYAQKRGYEVVAHFSEYFTGTTLDRPQLNEITKLIGSFDVLIVHSVNRLSRDPADLLTFHKHLFTRGTIVEYVIDHIDASTDIGQAMLFFQGYSGQQYRKAMLEAMARGKRGRASDGKVLVGDMPPYGYDYVIETGKLEVNEKEASIVKLIYKWYLEGDETGRKLGISAIATKLTGMRIPTKANAKRRKLLKKNEGVWNKSSIDRILKSETYTGIWYFNRRDTRGGKTVMRPRSEWISVPVPEIITIEQFESAQKQAKQNFSHSKRHTKRDYLLQHRLFCSHCGMRFCGQPGKGGYSYYLCGGQKIDNSVDGVTKTCRRVISVTRWDELVWEAIKYALLNPESILEGMRKRRYEIEAELEAIKQYLTNCESNIIDIENQESRLLDLYFIDKLPKDLLEQKMNELTSKKNALIERKVEYEQRIVQTVITQDHEELLKHYCELARVGIENFTFEEKRLVLEALNIQGTVFRGANKYEDYMVLTGFLPESVSGEYAIKVTTSKPCKVTVFRYALSR